MRPSRNKEAAGPSTLGELADLAFERFWAYGPSKKTYKGYVKFIKDRMRSTRLLTGPVHSWPDELVGHCRKHGNSNATTNRKLSCLSKMLTWAERQRWIDRAPHVDVLAEPKGRMRFAQPEEVLQLITLMPGPYGRLVEVLYETGLRVSEALRIRWEDWKDGKLSIWVSKGDVARTVPVTRRCSGALLSGEGCIDRHTSKTVGPFTDLDGKVLNYHWNIAKGKMHLAHDKEFVPHCLRHAYASRLVQAGIPLVVVKTLMGHKSINTTMVYSHLAPENIAQALEVLEN